jgi:hypothetical protein
MLIIAKNHILYPNRSLSYYLANAQTVGREPHRGTASLTSALLALTIWERRICPGEH